MQYKTIVLELINQLPKLNQQLVSSRSLLSTMEQKAIQFRQLHLDILSELQQGQPESSTELLRQQAGEIAISQMQEELQAIEDSLN